MATATAIAAIRTGLRIEFGTHEVFAAGATMSAPAVNPYLVDEV